MSQPQPVPSVPPTACWLAWKPLGPGRASAFHYTHDGVTTVCERPVGTHGQTRCVKEPKSTCAACRRALGLATPSDDEPRIRKTVERRVVRRRVTVPRPNQWCRWHAAGTGILSPRHFTRDGTLTICGRAVGDPHTGEPLAGVRPADVDDACPRCVRRLERELDAPTLLPLPRRPAGSSYLRQQGLVTHTAWVTADEREHLRRLVRLGGDNSAAGWLRRLANEDAARLRAGGVDAAVPIVDHQRPPGMVSVTTWVTPEERDLWQQVCRLGGAPSVTAWLSRLAEAGVRELVERYGV